MTRIFVLRPEPGLSATLAKAREMGLDAVAAPLAEVEDVAWSSPSNDSFDGLLLGSANALRHAGPAIDGWRNRSAYVVGEATAQAAREAGFIILRTGTGGLQNLLDDLGESDLRLLRLAGEKHLPLAPPEGVTIATRIVYRVVHKPISGGLASNLRDGGIVLLHSGETARHFTKECNRLQIEHQTISIAALAPRIAEAAGDGWRRVASAPAPTDRALLELARDMCH